ncbi:hypothetical protein [Sphaerobacter thermophilus]|uniref:hypothetical protein n=1 Tax=Sphaerobacter thermophilus TaxID=2057 RepID=UPI0039C0E0CE
MGAQTFEIQFGRGLDRASGHLAAAPETMRDLRNVYVRDTRLEIRKGAVRTATVGDTITGVFPFITEQAGVLTALEGSSLRVYLVDGFGQGSPPLFLGDWGTLPEGAHKPPRTLGAEAGNRVFIAHDEIHIGKRLPTVIYQPFQSDTFVTLRQDLGGGEVDVKFRGVAKHLEYIVGWGFGNIDDQDRQEIVRISLPGLIDETGEVRFLPEHYWIVGTRGDPVVRCIPLGIDEPALLAFKSAETYLLFGYDQTNFGIRLIDSRHGLASSRLAVSYDGMVFFWSLEGPRVFDGPGASKELAIPLDLRAPPPSSLVQSGAIEDGWAEYVPERRAIRFVFGPLKYVLHLWNPTRPEWSYEEGLDEFCGGIIFGGGTPVFGPPSGAPSLHDVVDIETTSVRLIIEHSGAEGNEVLEVWLRPSGGEWFRFTPEMVRLPGPQSVQVTDLQPGTSYDVAVRYRRGPHFTPGYENDPDTWPSYEAGAFVTTMDAPVIQQATWERMSASSERILVTVSPVYNDVDLELLSGGVVVGTAPAPHSGPVTIAHVDPAGEQLHTYTARHRTAAKEGDESAPVSRWAGPDAPTLTEIIPQGVCVYTVRWTSASGSLYTEIEDDYPNSSFALRGTADPGQGEIQVAHGEAIDDCAGLGGEMIPVGVRIRHRQDSFGVSDYSQYAVDVTSLELCNACSFNGGGGGGGDDDPPPVLPPEDT